MKNVIYPGSLIEDIKLINEEEEPITKIQKRKTLAFMAIIFADVFLIVTGALFKNFQSACIAVVSFNNLYVVTSNFKQTKRSGKLVEQRFARKRILNLIENFQLESRISKDLPYNVSLEGLKDAVIVENENESYNNENNEDIDEYIEVVTSDIYYLDLNNKIKALREIKEIANTEKQKSIFGLKIKSSKKSQYTKNISLQALDKEDLPDELPVSITLKLK